MSTRNLPFSIKKKKKKKQTKNKQTKKKKKKKKQQQQKITLIDSKSGARKLFLRLKNEFETTIVNEPSVFEPLKVYFIWKQLCSPREKILFFKSSILLRRTSSYRALLVGCFGFKRFHFRKYSLLPEIERQSSPKERERDRVCEREIAFSKTEK